MPSVLPSRVSRLLGVFTSVIVLSFANGLLSAQAAEVCEPGILITDEEEFIANYQRYIEDIQCSMESGSVSEVTNNYLRQGYKRLAALPQDLIPNCEFLVDSTFVVPTDDDDVVAPAIEWNGEWRLICPSSESRPGITATPATLELCEGESGSYSVRLDSQPSGTVTVRPDIDISDLIASVSPTSLNFTANDWNDPKPFTVSAAEDSDTDNETYIFEHTVTGYGDLNRGGPVTVRVIDDENNGALLSVSALTIDEGGTGTYTVRLRSAPPDAVTITPSSSNRDVNVSPRRLTFTANNWNFPRTVTVSAVEDDDTVNDSAALTHALEGCGDPTGGTVAVTVIDNDGVLLSQSTLTIDEGGTGTYTVQLQSKPSETVTITPSSSNPDVSVSPVPLTFTAGNWNSPQTVTVSAGEDDDTVDDAASLTHAVSGYGDVTAGGTVSVTVIDNDPPVEPGVGVSQSTLTIDEGGTGTYTVQLQSKPSETVTITPSSSNPDVSVSPVPLTFTAGNWNSPQTVTVSAGEDDDTVDDAASLTHAVSGYGDVTAGGTVSVTVIDNDPPPEPEPGVRLSVSSLTLVEGGTGTYTVQLDSAPLGMVTVLPSSSHPDVTLSPTSLSFDVGNWESAQTVTVSAAPDDDAIDDNVTITHSVAGYGDVTDGGTVSVTVNDEPMPVVEQEKQAQEQVVIGLASNTLSNTISNVSARFSPASSGTSFSVGGQPIELDDVYGSDSWNPNRDGATLLVDDILRSTNFQIVFGAAEGTQARAPMQWTLWGRGDLQRFGSEPDRGSSYDSNLAAGYLGIDVRVDDRLLAGVAVSRMRSNADYSAEIGDASSDGRMEVRLNSLLPYVRFAPDRKLELWAIAGVGSGDIENLRPVAGTPRELTDIKVQLAAAGVRRTLAIGGPMEWALLGDLAFGRVETDDGTQAIAGLTVDVSRLRLGMEGGYTTELESGNTLKSFFEVAGRYDGGEGPDAMGVEVSPGLYVSNPVTGLGFEVRGRVLALHSAESYEEYGISMTASLSPRSDGLGPSLSLSPRWGAQADGADALWRDGDVGRLTPSAATRDAMSLDARVGYAMRAMSGVLTPFGELGLRDQDSQRLRIGVRYHWRHTDMGALSLELAGARLESLGDEPEHRVGVTGRLRF